MLKFFTEFCPLIAFFIGYKTGGILNATLYILIASIISAIITYIQERKINMFNLISTGLLMLSGSITLLSGSSLFIKIKPTILYSLFAIIFLLTSFKWKPAIQYALGSNIIFKDPQKWKILNLRFMWFFIMMAIANEYIWRNFSEDIWVNFKVFGAFPVSLIFIFLQMPFILRNKIPDIEN